MEIHHLEWSIPSIKSATKYLNFTNKGLIYLENKSTMDDFYLFNDS